MVTKFKCSLHRKPLIGMQVIAKKLRTQNTGDCSQLSGAHVLYWLVQFIERMALDRIHRP